MGSAANHRSNDDTTVCLLWLVGINLCNYFIVSYILIFGNSTTFGRMWRFLKIQSKLQLRDCPIFFFRTKCLLITKNLIVTLFVTFLAY